ncbi:hypothetical protein P7K49_015486, partial [Saguinus oedipus]
SYRSHVLTEYLLRTVHGTRKHRTGGQVMAHTPGDVGLTGENATLPGKVSTDIAIFRVTQGFGLFNS